MQIYIPHMNSLQLQCDQEYYYAYISHYWHIPLKKYACHSANICTIALPLYCAYIHHISVCITQTSKPAAFELSSTMHLCYVFDNHSYPLSSLNT